MSVHRNIISPGPDTKVIIFPEEKGASLNFILTLSSLLNNLPHPATELIILCIGSDRSTGDALGPLVGSMLESYAGKQAVIMGTLSEPVHALNLQQKLTFIDTNFSSPVILAVDASLGLKKHIGSIELGRGSLKPGSAVQKSLPPVGDFYITGIVNVAGFMEFMVLQSTRLNLVLKLSRFIGWGICRALSNVSWLQAPPC